VAGNQQVIRPLVQAGLATWRQPPCQGYARPLADPSRWQRDRRTSF